MESNQEPKLPTVDLRPLPGSHRDPVAQYSPAAAGTLHPDTPVEATVVLRRQAEPGAEAFSQALSRSELAARYGASAKDLELVTSTLAGLGLNIVESDAASRRVKVSGPAALMGHVFGTELQELSTAKGSASQRHRSGTLSVPAALDGVVTAVLGLDNRPQARTLFRVAPAAAAAATSYTPLQIGQLYEFPTGQDGTGTDIAIIELGGGYAQTELDTYFTKLGITRGPVTAVGVDGATNVAGQDPSGADGEVLLDIEVAGALAPGANISVYFAPNTDAGFLDAVSQAAHASPTPAVMSISWGQGENQWTAQALTAMDQAFADAAILGVTVTVAAGDGGSTDSETDGLPHVDFPASSPHVLACGGTSLKSTAGKVTSESVWNNGAGNGATGGGISQSFPLPAWQQNVGVPLINGKTGRGVPDVAGDADPETGYQVLVDGTSMVIGGTSAVAPLWAALISRLAQAAGKPLGLIQPVIYSNVGAGKVPTGFRDISTGNNGSYTAGPGWDACTGLGVPDGTALAPVLDSGAAG